MGRTHNCFFKGRMTKDPELDTSASGKSVCEFRVARQRGPGRDAVFMTCKAWEDLARYIVGKYRKGDWICIREASYETRKIRVGRGAGMMTVEIPFFNVYEIGEDDGGVRSDTSTDDGYEDIPY